MHVGHGRGHGDGLGLEVGHALGLGPDEEVLPPLVHGVLVGPVNNTFVTTLT